MENQFIDVKGKSLAYWQDGVGDTIVLLHGWPQSSYVWRKVTPLLATKHRVVLIDLPGLGESQSHGRFDTAAVAEIIYEATQALDISRFHLVGHDVGAWVAATFALQYEQSLTSLTVVDAGIPGLMPDQMFRPDNAARVWQFYFHAVSEIPELLTKGKEHEYLSWYFNNKSIVKDGITERDINFYTTQYQREFAMANGFAYYRAFSKSAEQNQAYQKKISIPVLAIGGESAVGASIGAAMNKIASTVTTQVIEKCGHYVPEERPREFSESLLGFVSG